MNPSYIKQFKSAAMYPYDGREIQAAPDLAPGESHPSLVQVQNYLKHYGYLELEAAVPGRLDEPTTAALAKFQRRFKVGIPGMLDAATREAMSAPRCGIPDMADPLAFNTIGPFDHRDLRFAFGRRLTSQVSRRIVINAVRRAFDTWEAAGVGLTFTQVRQSQRPDILIEWRDAADPDHSMVGGVLAHADFPLASRLSPTACRYRCISMIKNTGGRMALSRGASTSKPWRCTRSGIAWGCCTATSLGA